MTAYGFNFQGKTFVPSGEVTIVETPEQTAARNAAITAEEITRFLEDKPERVFLYIKQDTAPSLGGDFRWSKGEGKATTWTGAHLGSVTFGREYKCPAFGGFFSVRVPVRITAINGCTYAGTYYKSSGDYARVRKVKVKGKGER